jgi:hypothetical protein
MAKRKKSARKPAKAARKAKPERKRKGSVKIRRRTRRVPVAAIPVPDAFARLKLDLKLPGRELDLNIPPDIGDPEFKLPPLSPITAPLSIVGIIPTSTLINALNASSASRIERFDVPRETVLAVPMLMGTMHGFARATLSPEGKVDITTRVIKANLFADILSFVTIENLLDPVPPSDRKQLEVKVNAVLQSGREFEDWFAVVSYTLLLLRLGSGE